MTTRLLPAAAALALLTLAPRTGLAQTGPTIQPESPPTADAPAAADEPPRPETPQVTTDGEDEAATDLHSALRKSEVETYLPPVDKHRYCPALTAFFGPVGRTSPGPDDEQYSKLDLVRWDETTNRPATCQPQAEYLVEASFTKFCPKPDECVSSWPPGGSENNSPDESAKPADPGPAGEGPDGGPEKKPARRSTAKNRGDDPLKNKVWADCTLDVRRVSFVGGGWTVVNPKPPVGVLVELKNAGGQVKKRPVVLYAFTAKPADGPATNFRLGFEAQNEQKIDGCMAADPDIPATRQRWRTFERSPGSQPTTREYSLDVEYGGEWYLVHLRSKFVKP